MIKWIIMVLVVALLAYLADVGVIPLLAGLRTPFLDASVINVLLVLVVLGMLLRIAFVIRRGRRESLKKRIEELEKEQAEYKSKQSKA